MSNDKPSQSQHRTLTLAGLQARLAPHFLQVLGSFRPNADDDMPDWVASVVMLGPVEPGFWPHLTAQPEWDGAPDPVVGLGKDGTYDPSTFMGELAAMSGASTYQVPAGIDPAAYNEVYVWCRAANVPLSVARVN